MNRFSCRTLQWVWAVVVAATPACNLVLGNEEGVLDDGGGSTAEPMPDPDAAPAVPDSDASATDPDASSTDPDAVMDPEADSGDEATIDAWATDSDRKDSAKSYDGPDGPRDRTDADGASSCDTGVSVCAEGQIATEMQACGPCGRGVQTRKRTCAAGGCGWGVWSAWSACSVLTAECTPGQSSSETQACGPCNTGTQSRTRSCTAACTWGAWGAFGDCGGITAECLPNHWRCCGAGMWEWCYTNRCMWTGGCAACSGCGC